MNNRDDFSVEKKFCPVVGRNVVVKLHHADGDREECLDGGCAECKNEYLRR